MPNSKPINFDALHLIVDRDFPNYEFFTLIKDNIKEYDNYKDIFYKIEECELTNNFFWLYIRCGSQFPYANEVVNVENYEESENPRNINDIELRSQIFLLYNFSDNTLYLSNQRKILI